MTKTKQFTKILLFVFLLTIVTILSGCDLASPGTLESLKSESDVLIEGGGFTEGSVLEFNKITDQDTIESIQVNLENEDYNKESEIYIYDISVKQDNVKVQPNGKVKVTIPAPDKNITNYLVFHVKNNNEVEKLIPEYNNGLIIFSTDSFSYFVVVNNQSNETYAFKALTTGNGVICQNQVNYPNGVQVNLKANENIILTANPNEGYVFKGWYEVDETIQTSLTFKEEAVSVDATYTFTMGTSEYTVYACFDETITGLLLDGANAGFNQNGNVTYVIGSESMPNPSLVLLYGITLQNVVLLVKDTDYTIEGIEDIDYTTVGEYTVNYVYTNDSSIKAFVTIKVVVANTMNIIYTGITDISEKYNGGTAAFIDKTMFTINDVPCDDITAVDGLSYEWRNSSTNEVVDAAQDWTLDDQFIESPAVVGVYDFVVYRTLDEEKTPLISITKTIINNQFELATSRDQINGGYYCNIIVGIVDGAYYVMHAPTSDQVEVEGILVNADENGILTVGDEYAYTFRTYHYLDNQRHAPRDDTSPDTLLYDFRTGRGPYQLGTLLLYTSGISWGGANGDSGILIKFNEDNTANISEPFMASENIHLVYDNTKGKYLFTCSTKTETRPTYDVYIYREYILHVEPTTQFEYTGENLSKPYDGNAVQINAYKDLIINTENSENLFDLLKMETGRLAWLDAKEYTVVAEGTVDEGGNVVGPSEVGTYILVLQLAEILKDGTTGWNNITLHEFSIYQNE